MYMTIEKARGELEKRWNDLGLRRKVRDYIGEIPDFLRHGPRAVLARHLATPNNELHHFSQAAAKAGLKPLCSEYTDDRFCTRNPDKLLLGKMTFFHGKGRNNGDKTTAYKIIDFNVNNQKPLSAIKTHWDEGFVGFHHRLTANKLPGVEMADSSGWLRSMGGKPAQFWHRHLALFMCHGILFENFHTEGHEADFTREIIQPAMKRVNDHFGLRPLIVPLVPLEREREPYWSWYPSHLEPEIALQHPKKATAHRLRVRPSWRGAQLQGGNHG